MADHSQIGRSNNRKGREFELEVANWLSKIFGVSFRRVPRSGGLREFNSWDIMRFRGPKSVNPKRDTILDRVGIECKNESAKFPVFLEKWITQCEESARDENIRDWFLIFHRPGTAKNYALVPQEYLERLFRELEGYRQEEEL